MLEPGRARPRSRGVVPRTFHVVPGDNKETVGHPGRPDGCELGGDHGMPRMRFGLRQVMCTAAMVLAVAGCSGDGAPDQVPVPGPEAGPAPTVKALPTPPACTGRTVRVGADIQAAIDAAGPNGRLGLAAG